MQLRFVKSELTFTYFEATRGYLEKHGKPLALYSDKASVFRINNKNATGGDGYTQFGRAMHELNIQTICANTSSAKGRVERAHLTLLDRLVKELRLKGKAGKARYIGASSMEAWRFAKMQHTAERNGWTRFITMQPQYNLLYREEEREMLPLCEDQGVGVIPWSPMARGRLTRDWSVTSRRTQNDAFALKMYENAALLDKPVIDVVASIAEKHAVPRAHVAIAWLLSKSVITAPIIGATKPEHLSTAISALDFSLSDAEITELEVRYLPHPVDGIIPPLPDTPPSLTPPSAIQNY